MEMLLSGVARGLYPTVYPLIGDGDLLQCLLPWVLQILSCIIPAHAREHSDFPTVLPDKTSTQRNLAEPA